MKEGSLPDERRVALDLLDVREGIEEIGDKIRWVPTYHMLVDCMTKAMQPDAMLEYLKTGKYAFKYDKEIKDTKREVAKTRKAAKDAKKLLKDPKVVKQVQFLSDRNACCVTSSDRNVTKTVPAQASPSISLSLADMVKRNSFSLATPPVSVSSSSLS